MQINALFKVILIIGILTFTGVAGAYLYDQIQSKSEYPGMRLVNAQLNDFDEYLQTNRYEAGLNLLDSIEHALKGIPFYAQSYELGIVNNNRASVYLYKALYADTCANAVPALLDSSFKYIHAGIHIYNKWLQVYQHLDEAAIKNKLLPYLESDTRLNQQYRQRVLNRKVQDYATARLETQRRLSVSYTNLGIMNKHRNDDTNAIRNYNNALSLWRENQTAINNLRAIQGLPPEKKSFVERLFPPDRKKE